MSIQKKSLLSGLNATKKAIVASSTTTSQGTPSVSAPIAARVLPKASARVLPKASARVLPKASARVLPKASARVLPKASARMRARVKSL
jgi:glutathione S-transferase